jgi:hypothetical protein
MPPFNGLIVKNVPQEGRKGQVGTTKARGEERSTTWPNAAESTSQWGHRRSWWLLFNVAEKDLEK